MELNAALPPGAALSISATSASARLLPPVYPITADGVKDPSLQTLALLKMLATNTEVQALFTRILVKKR